MCDILFGVQRMQKTEDRRREERRKKGVGDCKSRGLLVVHSAAATAWRVVPKGENKVCQRCEPLCGDRGLGRLAEIVT